MLLSNSSSAASIFYLNPLHLLNDTCSKVNFFRNFCYSIDSYSNLTLGSFISGGGGSEITVLTVEGAFDFVVDWDFDFSELLYLHIDIL